MPRQVYYRDQAHRCLLLSRSILDRQARLWLTDMAVYYAEKARRIEEGEMAPSSRDPPPFSVAPSSAIAPPRRRR